MKRKRLKRLANLLRRDARNKHGVKFNLGFWAGPADDYFNHVFPTIPTKPVPIDCGTSACAMGLAVISGEFEKEGLTANYSARAVDAGYALEPMIVDKDGTNRHGFDAAQTLFNITAAQAHWLFAPQYYPRNKRKGAKAEMTVVRRIDYLVRKGKLPHGMKDTAELVTY